MYTQFFGNYLLNQHIITSEQLVDAMQNIASSHLKLGTLAIYEGFLTSSEVNEIHILQTHMDKRFGQIAVDEGFLTQEQLDILLSKQKPRFLNLGQALIDKGYITNAQFEKLIINYQLEHEIIDLDFSSEQKENINVLVNDFFDSIPDILYKDECVEYFTLLFNDLVRFIGDDFTLLSPAQFPEYPAMYCSSQNVFGPVNIYSALDMDEATAIEFACRYAGEEFDEMNEYVMASMDDFLNLHNGLYVVNMSNEKELVCTLDPPVNNIDSIISPNGSIYHIPVIYPFGTVNILFAISEDADLF